MQLGEMRSVRNANAGFASTVVRAPDGVELTTYAAGDPGAPAVVLVNAYLMGVDFMRPLSASLLPRYRVLTWDSRLPLETPPGPDAPALGLAAQASDLAVVMRHYAAESAVGVVGWCTGAAVALRFAANHPERVRALVLLNGAYPLSDAYPRTPYDLAQVKMLLRIAKKPYLARVFCRMMEVMRERPASEGEAESELLARVGTRDDAIVEMVVRRLSDPKAVSRYALLIEALHREPEMTLEDIGQAALVVTARGDTIAHPERSIEIARRLAGATLHVDETGDHYVHYTSEPTRDRIRAFLDAHAGAP